ncbi:AraC family transcriptional regulator [Cytophagales bacterium WSM2-2]|nr:AraC family transcriptional regulator [Cytophagales bacterium WSM2-2]
MPKKSVPLFHIQQHCFDNGVANFKAGSFSEESCTIVEFEENHRHEYYEIIWLKNGVGHHHIDLLPHHYSGSVLFLLAPGQIHRIEQTIPSEGYIVKFLPSVFKMEKEFNEYIMDGCLFDNTLTSPVITVPEHLNSVLESLFLNLIQEFRQLEPDAENIVSSYLKILITHIHRIQRKLTSSGNAIGNPRYELFRKFKVAIESQYKQRHSVQHYADVLSTQPRSLNSVSREFAGKSAGEVIHERILLEAKRSLYHETKSVKEISFELGFEDPAYFTRFFKKHEGIAPQYFKEQKTLEITA